MRTTLTTAQAAAYLARQVTNFFPDREVVAQEFGRYVDAAVERLEYCFRRVTDKYLPEGKEPLFNHRHTDHYAMFLCLVANSVRRLQGNIELADKVYALNKALHAVDVFHEVELPDIFMFVHPLGTVLGRAKYSNYLMVYQRCTVGAKDQVYPTIGEGTVMFGGSTIVGGCAVGDNVWLSSGSQVIGQDIPSDSAVFGQSPHLIIKPTRRNVIRDLFNHPSGRTQCAA